MDKSNLKKPYLAQPGGGHLPPLKLMLLLGWCGLLLLMSFSVITQEDPPPTAPQSTPAVETTTEATAPSSALVPAPPRPLAAQSFTEGGVTVNLLFERLPQGRVGVLHISGPRVTGARLRFLDKLTDFYRGEDGDYYGLMVANMDLAPRSYDLSVFVWLDDGTRVTVPVQVDVVLGGFIRQNLTVAPDRAYLLDVQVERNEFARLNSVMESVTPGRMWVESGFQLPIASELTSPFGAYRVFNETVPSRHTGWDLRAPVGVPVMAMAAGKVAFAGLMDIRGNHIIIDHGEGVFSGYSHLSQVHVTRGQSIERGQIIGVSGNTGRSGGAHLHWEVAVLGEWVDSADFLQTWLP